MDFITLRNLRKTYHLGEVDVPALKGISLTVARGEMVALMGPSGGGKSTLMNILGCLDHATDGEYWLDGQEVSRLSPKERARLRNRLIGFVFQNFNLLPRTTALENVILPLNYSRQDISEKQMRERGEQLLARVGLSDRAHHQPSELSGGQQQRVAIARSLVNHPSLLFADEPTGNLDSHTSEEILEMFQKLHGQEGITIVLVTHDLGVARHAGRVIHMKDGLLTRAETDTADASGAQAAMTAGSA